MILVDEKGVLYNTEELQVLSNIGNTATVYKLGEDKILKVCKDNFILTPEIIYINDLFKDNYKHIVTNLSTLKNQKNDKVSGYIAKRYEEKGRFFILDDKDKLLETIFNLDETIVKLSEKRIDLYDCFLRCNFILDDELTIVDTWAFFLRENSVSEILKQNRTYISAMITEALISDIMEEEYCGTVMEYFELIRKSLDLTKALEPQYRKSIRNINGPLINSFKK